MRHERTPSQTVGPFFSFGLCTHEQNRLVVPNLPGAVRIEGRVIDGADEPVPDAMVEIWPPFGRCGTDAEGRYSFVTTLPPASPGQCPHLTVLVFARGLLKPVLTRMYAPDVSFADDPVLAGIVDERERSTLIPIAEGDALHFDIHLQGAQQTAFFSL